MKIQQDLGAPKSRGSGGEGGGLGGAQSVNMLGSIIMIDNNVTLLIVVM